MLLFLRSLPSWSFIWNLARSPRKSAAFLQRSRIPQNSGQVSIFSILGILLIWKLSQAWMDPVMISSSLLWVSVISPTSPTLISEINLSFTYADRDYCLHLYLLHEFFLKFQCSIFASFVSLLAAIGLLELSLLSLVLFILKFAIFFIYHSEALSTEFTWTL